MKKIILASSSPRRQEILCKMGFDFEVIPSEFEENLENLDFSYSKIENLAYNKGKAVYDKMQSRSEYLILSADTVVVLENKILGKPKDKNEAITMLQSLSGKKHFVVTSACAISNGKNIILSETSYVEFNELTSELIINYVEQFKPLDKAGAYGIQELPDGFVKNIEGSFENIMGLCPEVVSRLLI